MTRVLSTFGITKYRSEERPPEQKSDKTLEKIVQFVEENFEDVGSDFAKEALKMHYGVSEHRNIRGVSSEQEEETLKQEGIPFFKIPTNVTPPTEDE